MDFREYTTEDYHEASQALNDADEILYHPWIGKLADEISAAIIVDIAINGMDAEHIQERIKDEVVADLMMGIYMGERKILEAQEGDGDE